ncbi:hypothetical protein GOV10_05310 [Candidatus Woesearchaeota archaeon]|nr:hypothetical protein [Candidatus Woesearchaeota archaeon]
MKFSFDSRALVAAGCGLVLWAGAGLWFGIDGVSCLVCAVVGALLFGVGVFLDPYDLVIGGGM